MHQLSTEILKLESKKNDHGKSRLEMARPPGLEPGTYSLEGCCTIQLCYGRSRAAQSAARRAYYIKEVARALYKTTNSPNRRLIPVPPLEQRSYHHRQAHRR